MPSPPSQCGTIRSRNWDQHWRRIQKNTRIRWRRVEIIKWWMDKCSHYHPFHHLQPKQNKTMPSAPLQRAPSTMQIEINIGGASPKLKKYDRGESRLSADGWMDGWSHPFYPSLQLTPEFRRNSGGTRSLLSTGPGSCYCGASESTSGQVVIKWEFRLYHDVRTF